MSSGSSLTGWAGGSADGTKAVEAEEEATSLSAPGGAVNTTTTAEESVAETTSFYHKLQSEINVLRSRVDQQLSRMLTASAKEIESLSTQLLNLQQTPASAEDNNAGGGSSRKRGGGTGSSPSSLSAMQLRTRAVRWREQRLRHMQASAEFAAAAAQQQQQLQMSPTSQTTSTSATTSVMANTRGKAAGGGNGRRNNKSKRLNERRPSPYDHHQQHRRIGASESSESSSVYLNQQVNASLRISSSTVTAPITNLTRHATARRIHNLTWEERSAAAAASAGEATDRLGGGTGGVENSNNSVAASHRFPLHRVATDASSLTTSTRGSAMSRTSPYPQPPPNHNGAATTYSRLSSPIPTSLPSRTPTPPQQQLQYHQYNTGGLTLLSEHHIMPSEDGDTEYDQHEMPVEDVVDEDDDEGEEEEEDDQQFLEEGEEILLDENPSGYVGEDDLDRIMAYRRTQSQQSEDLNQNNNDYDDYPDEEPFDVMVVDEDDDSPIIPEGQGPTYVLQKQGRSPHHSDYDDEGPVSTSFRGPQSHPHYQQQQQVYTVDESEDADDHDDAGDDDGGHQYGGEYQQYTVGDVGYNDDDYHQHRYPHGEAVLWRDEHSDAAVYSDYSRFLQDEIKSQSGRSGTIREEEPEELNEDEEYDVERRQEDEPDYSYYYHDRVERAAANSGNLGGHDGDPPIHSVQSTTGSYRQQLSKNDHLDRSSGHHASPNVEVRQRRLFFPDDERSTNSALIDEVQGRDSSQRQTQKQQDNFAPAELSLAVKTQDTQLNSSQPLVPGQGNKLSQVGETNSIGADRSHWLPPLAKGTNDSNLINNSSSYRSASEAEAAIQGIIGHLATAAAQRRKWDAPMTAPRRANGVIPLEPDSTMSDNRFPTSASSQTPSSSSPDEKSKLNFSTASTPKAIASTQLSTTTGATSVPSTTASATSRPSTTASATSPPSTATDATARPPATTATSVTESLTTASSETSLKIPASPVPPLSATTAAIPLPSAINAVSVPPSSTATTFQPPSSIAADYLATSLSSPASTNNHQEEKKDDDLSSISKAQPALEQVQDHGSQVHSSASRTAQAAWDQLQDHSSQGNSATSQEADEDASRQGVKRVVRVLQVKNKLMTDPYDDLGFYTGMLVRGKPHGPGVMMYFDGRRYEGEWKLGHWDGRGKTLFSNGDTYVGEYKMDERYGVGRYEWRDGRVYIGEFVHDHREGQGTYTFPDGSVYTGGFLAGQRHGHGCYKFVDSSVYTGEFKEGKYHGIGECVWADGRCYRGEWLEGRAHGYGVERRADGTIRHDGEWQNDRPVRRSRKEKKILSAKEKAKEEAQLDARLDKTKAAHHGKEESMDKKKAPGAGSPISRKREVGP